MAVSNLVPAATGPTTGEIATAVAAAVPTSGQITTIVQSNAGATLAQHQEFSAGNWAWLGRTAFDASNTSYTISGLADYKKIRIHISSRCDSGSQDVFLRLNGATSGYNSSYGGIWSGNVGGQIVNNWSLMRLSDTAINQQTTILCEIESPTGGHSIVTSENFINGGSMLSSGYNHGKSFHLNQSTTKVANLTVMVAMGQLVSGTNFGISVWGMK